MYDEKSEETQVGEALAIKSLKSFKDQLAKSFKKVLLKSFKKELLISFKIELSKSSSFL